MSNYISFENAYGRIEMGGTRKDLWRITSITGLTPVEVDAQIKKYAKVPGQKTLEVQPKAREIIIKGSLNTREKGQRQFRLTQATRIFDTTKTVIMRCNFTGKLRRIECRPTSFNVSHYNAAGQEFTLSLTADNPYFRDWEDVQINLFSRKPNLVNNMTFPRVFTIRAEGGAALNNGAVDIEPVIVITATSPSAGETGLTIVNTTTGAEIYLNYAPPNGDIITVDIENRKITSSINGDILQYKSKDTLLSKFVLVSGLNVIGFINANTAQELTAYIRYSNLYTEAVY